MCSQNNLYLLDNVLAIYSTTSPRFDQCEPMAKDSAKWTDPGLSATFAFQILATGQECHRKTAYNLF